MRIIVFISIACIAGTIHARIIRSSSSGSMHQIIQRAQIDHIRRMKRRAYQRQHQQQRPIKKEKRAISTKKR